MVVAPTAATVAKIASVFFMRISSIENLRDNADVSQWLQGTRRCRRKSN
jgi:hypothetical protein